jgi:hypothetical protein
MVRTGRSTATGTIHDLHGTLRWGVCKTGERSSSVIPLGKSPGLGVVSECKEYDVFRLPMWSIPILGQIAMCGKQHHCVCTPKRHDTVIEPPSENFKSSLVASVV